MWASAGSMGFVVDRRRDAQLTLPRHPARDYEPTGPFRWLGDLLFLRLLGHTGLMILGLLAMVSTGIAFLLVLREAWHGRLSMRAVAIVAVVFHVVVLTLPLLFSRDVYSYAYYGRIVEHVQRQPLHHDAEGLPSQLAVPLHVARVARHAVGVRTPVHVDLGGDHHRHEEHPGS